MIRYSMKLSFTHAQISAAMVFFFFSALVLSSRYIKIDYSYHVDAQEEKTAEVFELDMASSLAMSGQSGGVQVESVMELGIENPDIMILKLETRKNKKQLFDDFLAGLVQNSHQNQALVYSGETSGSVAKQGNSGINYQAMAGQLTATTKIAQAKEIGVDELREMIKKYDHKFQDCYQKSLLKDELLSGKAVVTLTFGKSAIVDFKGVGRTAPISELKSCLAAQAVTIADPGTEQRKVRFSLIF